MLKCAVKCTIGESSVSLCAGPLPNSFVIIVFHGLFIVKVRASVLNNETSDDQYRFIWSSVCGFLILNLSSNVGRF